MGPETFRQRVAAFHAACAATWTAHTPRYRREPGSGPFHTRARAMCTCGWESAENSADLRPQWQAFDTHIDPLLPTAPRGHCFCGRLVIVTPMGNCVHAAFEFLAHDARPATSNPPPPPPPRRR